MEGWINLDKVAGPGVDIVMDLEAKLFPLFCEEHDFEEMFLSHVFEHFREPLVAMENLWLMAKPGCKLIVRCPWGGSHIAFEDPTHVRAVFLQTMHYFGQTAYNAADYGYRGDWECRRQILILDPEKVDKTLPVEMLVDQACTLWNVATEIISELYCIKPARAPGTPSPGYRLEVAFPDDLSGP